MEEKNCASIRNIMYVVVLATSCLPLACGYVMDGGDIHIWLSRIEEVKEGLSTGHFRMFPSAELVVANNGQFSALNSNLWMLLPAIMRLVGVSVTAVYRIYMLGVNILGMLTAKRMFSTIYEDKTTVFFGVLLYMTCPYRIYVYYDKASLGMAAAWAVIPLVIGELLFLFRRLATLQSDVPRRMWEGKRMILAAIAFALVGYADGILMLITGGIILLGILWYRKWMAVLPLLAGSGLSLPGMVSWIRYCLTGGMEVWDMPLKSITSKGYSLGQFFSGWVYRTDCPGLGLGLMLTLAVALWIGFTEKECEIGKRYGFSLALMCLLSLLSMNIILWDMIPRLGMPFLRLVGLMETPGVLFGFASLAACVPAAYGVECAQKQKRLFVKWGIPLIVGFAAIGAAVYLCNTMTYNRLPMFL